MSTTKRFRMLRVWMAGALMAVSGAGGMTMTAGDVAETFDDGTLIYEIDPHVAHGAKIVGCMLPAGTEMNEWEMPEFVVRSGMTDDRFGGNHYVTGVSKDAFRGIKIRNMSMGGYSGWDLVCPDVEGLEKVKVGCCSTVAPYGFAGKKIHEVWIHTYGCGSFAFQGAEIDSLTFQSALPLAYVGTGAFDNCSIGTLTIMAKEPPAATPESFGVYGMELPGMESEAARTRLLRECVLMVPRGAAKKYRNAPGWSLFKNIKELKFDF